MGACKPLGNWCELSVGRASAAAEQIVREADKLQEKRGQIRQLYGRLFTREAMEDVLRRNVLPLIENH